MWKWLVMAGAVIILAWLLIPSEKDKSEYTLGQLLFFDPNLSSNGTKSCASCHSPDFAFTDGYRKSVGAFGDASEFNAPGLLDLDRREFFSWRDTTRKSLYEAVERPFFAHPKELGWKAEDTTDILFYVKNNNIYRPLISENFWWSSLIEELEKYLLNIPTGNSVFEKQLREKNEMDSLTAKGFEVFASRKKCITCHTLESFNFSNHLVKSSRNILFDNYKYQTPNLRNVLLTAPYMHDGHIGNISDAIRHNTPLSDEEQKAIIHFLSLLTDTTYLSNPIYKNPF